MPTIDFLTYPVSLIDISDATKQSLMAVKSDCFMIVNHKYQESSGTWVGWNRSGQVHPWKDVVYYLPCYPDSISESQSATWTTINPLGRSSPLSTYVGTEFREFTLNIRLHREMVKSSEEGEAYIDEILTEMRRAVYPYYTAKGLVPPITTFQFGKFKCKGYVRSISYNWQKPIINGHYQLCDVSLGFVDVPNKVYSAKDLGVLPTNPYNRS